MERVLKQSGAKALFLVISLLAVSHSALATTAIIPADDEMIVAARAIVRGKVVSVESGLDGQNRIFTYITLKVQEVLKGQISERRIVIKEPGGEVGNRGSLVFGTPRFARGDKVLLYLDTWRDGSLRVHQMFLGRFSIVSDTGSGETFVTRNTPDLDVSVVGQSTNGRVTNRLELSKYTEMVRDRLAANRERSREFEAAVYNGIPLLPRPTEYKASAEGGDVSPEFHLWNPPIRWFEADSGQQVVFKTNPDSAPSPQVENDVAAATNCWSTVPGCSLRVADGGTTTGCGLFLVDGENTVSFNNCDGYFSGTGTCSAGILAVTSIANYDRSQTRVVNGVSFYKALESNLSFNPFASCYFSDHCNLQEIITHEMGHGLGLHHSWDSSFPGSPSPTDQAATMYWVAHFDGRCASLRADDINAITFVYPSSGGGPGPLTIVTSSLSGGTVGTSYTQSLSASGGTPPYAWSLVQGQGTLPPGLSLSGGGVITGTPTTAGTYNFTVRVTDNVAATAQSALGIVVGSGGGGGALNSQFVSQTVPASVQPGQSFTSNLKFLNTGTQAWSGSAYYFGSQNPPLNQTWGGNGVSLVGFSAAPGEVLDVTFTATAPVTPGTYNFQWQMYKNDGTGFFGQMSTNVAVQVGGATDNATFASQTVPSSMIAGHSSAVSVTMNNTGTTTWSPGNYYLGSQNPQDNMTWGLNRANLSSPVAPGGQATFSFNITAPSSAGQYNFQWRVANDAVSYFGSMSTNVVVTVSSSSTHTGTIGLYNSAGGAFFLRDSNSGGIADTAFTYGPAGLGWVPITGDWDGDGVATIGLYDPTHAAFFLRNSNTGGIADISFTFGPAGMGFIPIVGDWNGDGIDTVGLYDPAHAAFFLRNSNTGGIADISFTFGPAGLGFVPITGDWDGDGIVTVGLYDPTHAAFFLRNSNSGGIADISFTFGPAGLGWIPIVGDWNGDGTDTVGLYDPAHAGYFLRNFNTGGVADITFTYGPAGLGWSPVVGDWNGL